MVVRLIGLCLLALILASGVVNALDADGNIQLLNSDSKTVSKEFNKVLEAPASQMSKLIPATLSVNGNEKAYSMQEVHLQSPGSRGFHRYRIFIVKRDGKLAEFREDMGKASQFKGIKQFNVPAIWEHTIDELLDIADVLRTETLIDVKDWLGLNTMKLA